VHSPDQTRRRRHLQELSTKLVPTPAFQSATTDCWSRNLSSGQRRPITPWRSPTQVPGASRRLPRWLVRYRVTL
jgi:hypothetical protein